MAGSMREESRRGKQLGRVEVLVATCAIITAVAWLFLVGPVIRWIIANFSTIVTSILMLIAFGIVIFFGWSVITDIREQAALAQRKRMEAIAAERAWEHSLPARIMQSINRFNPSQRYQSEIGYHAELQGWLKQEFPSAKVEVQSGASRPDIVIDQIAIEIKGPTYDVALKSLTDRCMRYLQHHDGLVIVLFEPRYTRRLFNEVATGITKLFHGQVWLIEK